MITPSPLALQKEAVFQTDTGIPLYLYPSPHLHSFCLCLYLRAGSMFETAEDNGITHAVEHAVFRNINRLMDGRLYETLDRLGLCLEGTTYKEFVQFSITGAPCHLPRAAEILSLLFAPLTLTGKDWLPEKNRIKAEIREESERSTLDYFTDGILHEGTALARTITGTAGNVEAFSLNRLAVAASEIFSVNNAFFYLTGRVTEDDARLLAKAVDAFSPRADIPRRENLAPLPSRFLKRDATVAFKRRARHAVRFSVDVDTARLSDAPLMLLYDLLLGDGEECLLHRALSEDRGYIYSFRPSLELYRNMAIMSFSYEIPPAKLLPSVALAVETMASLKKEVRDLSPVRAPYTYNAEMILDDPSDCNFNRAYETKLLDLPYHSVADRAAAYAAVTEEQVTAAARIIFRPENVTLTVGGSRVNTDALREIILSL